LYPTWWWPQQHWPKHVVDKLYTPGNIVVLWLLYPYRTIALGSNKHNGDDAPWSPHIILIKDDLQYYSAFRPPKHPLPFKLKFLCVAHIHVYVTCSNHLMFVDLIVNSASKAACCAVVSSFRLPALCIHFTEVFHFVCPGNSTVTYLTICFYIVILSILKPEKFRSGRVCSCENRIRSRKWRLK